MKNLFNSVKVRKPGRNTFDLTHDIKMSMNMGELIPCMVMDCLPGDKVKLGGECLVRFAPLVAPLMHRVDTRIEYFFVPSRILWKNFKNFITTTKVAGVIPPVPYYEVRGSAVGNTYTRLLDYLGVPPPPASAVQAVSAIPLAVYQQIYNDYYRDQNLVVDQWNQDDIGLVDGNNTSDGALALLRKRAWEHDYFTSCLPFAQKGDEVTIPLSIATDVPVIANETLYGPDTDLQWPASSEPSSTAVVVDVEVQPPVTPSSADQPLYAQTAGVGASSTINDLRRAYRLQEFFEKLARGGSRLTEYIKVMFGVNSSDARLQRAEYITGVKSPVGFSEVLQTSQTDVSPQGTLAGHGVSVAQGGYGTYYCEEHGYIMGIMSVIPKTAYQNGIDRHWSRTSPYDYYQPPFANIGEQEVLLKELFAYGSNGGDTFGYNPRYSEYKFMGNRVAGDFRTSLDFWHLGRQFSTEPALNQSFVECSPRSDVFAVEDPDVQKLYVQVLNKCLASRLMPKYGTPTF